MENTNSLINIDANPFALFNELVSTGDKSYFKDIIPAIEPIGGEQTTTVTDFRDMLDKINSGKIFDKMVEAIWKNSPVVFVPRSEFHPDAIEKLTDAKFELTYDKVGIYITFSFHPFGDCHDFSIADIFSRAYTTRVLMPGIFHAIFANIVLNLDIPIKDKLEYVPPTNYINIKTVQAIVSKATNLETSVTDSKLTIVLNPMPDNASYFLKAIAEQTKELDRYYERLVQEATSCKHNTVLYTFDVNLSNILYKQLLSSGFECEKTGSSDIRVEWGNIKDSSARNFATTCWIRYNTVNYYRVCASTVTRALRQSPSDKAIIFLAPKKPIDNEFFEMIFNKRQDYRCEPIVFNDVIEKYIVEVKHEYVEKLKEKAYRVEE